MPDKPTYFIAQAIPYVNGRPHVGHALEAVLADAYARYHRQAGDDVLGVVHRDHLVGVALEDVHRDRDRRPVDVPWGAPQPVLLDHPAPLVGAFPATGHRRVVAHGSSPSTRSTLATDRTAGDSRSSCKVFCIDPSWARWVMNTSVASSPNPSCQTRSIETPL